MTFGYEDEKNLVLLQQIEELKCELERDKEYIKDLKVNVKGLEDELDRVFRENTLMRELLKEVL